MRKGIRGMVTLVLAVFLAMPSFAKYAPDVKVGEELKKEVRGGQMSLRKLSKKVRWALMAEVLALCYQSKGQPAYGKPVFHKKEKIYYYPVRQGSRFIGADGVEYGWCEVVHGKSSKEYPEWVKVKQAMEHAGVHAVLKDFPEEVTSLCRQTAARRIARMPEVMQDAFFAEMFGLYYVPDGSSAYLSRKKGGVNGSDMELEFWQVSDDACFVDRRGQKQRVAEMIAMRDKKDAATRRAWIQAMLCCQLIGKKDALEDFADVVRKLKKKAPHQK